MTYKISTDGPEATVKLGCRIGSLLRGGEVLDLIGDLGSGKTTIMKGILMGLGYTQDVPSPTYTISRVYKLKNNLELHHFDFYRINGSDVVVDELSEALGDSNFIIAIEWSSNISKNTLPPQRIKIILDSGSSDIVRSITIESGSKYPYVVKGLAQ